MGVNCPPPSPCPCWQSVSILEQSPGCPWSSWFSPWTLCPSWSIAQAVSGAEAAGSAPRTCVHPGIISYVHPGTVSCVHPGVNLLCPSWSSAQAVPGAGAAGSAPGPWQPNERELFGHQQMHLVFVRTVPC